MNICCSQSGKSARSRSVKRAGSESSQESLSLPPPSPAPDQLHLDPMSQSDTGMWSHDQLQPMRGLMSPDHSGMLVPGSSDPMLSLPQSPGASQVLGSPGLLVSFMSQSFGSNTVASIKSKQRVIFLAKKQHPNLIHNSLCSF